MHDRLASLKRLRRVQSQRCRLGEMRLTGLARREQELSAGIEDMISLLDGRLDSHAVMLDLVHRRIASLSREKTAVLEDRQAEEARSTADARLAKLFDRALTTAVADARRKAEATELAAVIERLQVDDVVG